MMFGVPAAALAMYHAKDESKTSLCLVLASSVSAFFVGVTEPIGLHSCL